VQVLVIVRVAHWIFIACFSQCNFEYSAVNEGTFLQAQEFPLKAIAMCVQCNQSYNLYFGLKGLFAIEIKNNLLV